METLYVPIIKVTYSIDTKNYGVHEEEQVASWEVGSGQLRLTKWPVYQNDGRWIGVIRMPDIFLTSLLLGINLMYDGWMEGWTFAQ